MKITKFQKCIVLILIFVCIPFNFSFAQHFIRMTDEQWIELALDMVRKGIQQQDTTKVFSVIDRSAFGGMVFAPQVKVKGKSMEVKGSLTTNVQAIFDNSSKRKLLIEKSSFPREDNPLHSSNFWDFDILDPQIKIEGDSAIVDCELVLWGAPPPPSAGSPTVKGSNQAGRRIRERLIFKVPPEVQQPLPPGDYHQWSASGKKQVTRIRSWKLVRSESLLDFLNEEINSAHE